MDVGHEQRDELLLDVKRFDETGEARCEDVTELVLVEEAAETGVGALSGKKVSSVDGWCEAKTYLRLKVAEQRCSNRSHPLTVPSDILAPQSKGVKDVKERSLTLSVTSVELNVTRDCSRDVEVDLDVLHAWLLEQLLVLPFQLLQRRNSFPSATSSLHLPRRDLLRHLLHQQSPHGPPPPIRYAFEDSPLQLAVLSAVPATATRDSAAPPAFSDDPVLRVPS